MCDSEWAILYSEYFTLDTHVLWMQEVDFIRVFLHGGVVALIWVPLPQKHTVIHYSVCVCAFILKVGQSYRKS